MNAKEFVKKFGWEASKKYISRAHKKATHIYIGFMETASYFYQHPSLNWCEVDSRTIGWDSDKCCYNVHPPVSLMFVIEELKTLVDAYEFVSAHKSIKVAKKYCDLHDPYGTSNHYNNLRARIELVESCQ